MPAMPAFKQIIIIIQGNGYTLPVLGNKSILITTAASNTC